MATTSSHTVLLALLDRAIAGNATRRFSTADCSLPPPRAAITSSTPRLSLVLSGRRVMRICQRGALLDLPMATGHALFAPNYAWTEPLFPCTCTSIGIGFRRGYIRVLANRGQQARPQRGAGPQFWYHTPLPLTSAGRHALNALVDLSERHGDAETASDLVNALLRFVRQGLCEPSGELPTRAQELYRAALELLEARCHQEVGRDDIADHLGVHPNHLSRLFREQGGEGFMQHLTRLRLALACRLLTGSDLAVAAVATACGFGDTGHFIRSFRAAYDLSPGRYRLREAGLSGPAPARTGRSD